MESLSLFELNEYIQRVIALNFEESMWVHFELSNIKSSRGHHYFDCVEKKEDSDEIVARSSGVIWARQYSFIQKKLRGLEKEMLRDGVRISAKVMVDFHPRYGMKLVIEDIDPAYTFGELAIEKEQTWNRIQKQGLHEKNQRLRAPLVIQRIAILSNDTAAGYVDFIGQLNQNLFGYSYDLTLFETALQGNLVKRDIPDQVEVINEEKQDFDLVVVIRGGGSKLDMQSFDQYDVVKALALCEVPVWTGIGHEIDESLSDLVVSRSLKTPTAVAASINDHNYQFESQLMLWNEEIDHWAQQRIKWEDQRMDQAQFRLSSAIEQLIGREHHLLSSSLVEIDHLKNQKIRAAQWSMEKHLELLQLMDPQEILNKGFALVEKGKERVTRSSQIKSKDEIKVHLKDQSIQAIVK